MWSPSLKSAHDPSSFGRFGAHSGLCPPDQLIERNLGRWQEICFDLLGWFVAAHREHRKEIADVNGCARGNHLQFHADTPEMFERARPASAAICVAVNGLRFHSVPGTR